MATCCYHSFSHWLTVCFQSDRAHYLFVPHNSSLKQVLLCPFHRPRSWSSKDLNDFFQTKERFHCIPWGSRQLVYPFTLGSHITSLNLRKPVVKQGRCCPPQVVRTAWDNALRPVPICGTCATNVISPSLPQPTERKNSLSAKKLPSLVWIHCSFPPTPPSIPNLCF